MAVDVQLAVLVTQQVPTQVFVDTVQLLHIGGLGGVGPPVDVITVIVVAQDAVHPVLAPQLLEDVDVGQHFLRPVIDQVAGEYDEVGLLAVDHVYGIVQGGSARPATGMNVADLHDLQTLQPLRQVGDGHVDGKTAVAVGVAHHTVGQGNERNATRDQGGLTEKTRPAGVTLRYGTCLVE